MDRMTKYVYVYMSVTCFNTLIKPVLPGCYENVLIRIKTSDKMPKSFLFFINEVKV